MKGNQVKSEFKIHKAVLYFDKNIDNYLKNKYIISLGYDDPQDPSIMTTSPPMILKIWEFISLDDYCKDASGMTGGSYFDRT